MAVYWHLTMEYRKHPPPSTNSAVDSLDSKNIKKWITMSLFDPCSLRRRLIISPRNEEMLRGRSVELKTYNKAGCLLCLHHSPKSVTHS